MTNPAPNVQPSPRAPKQALITLVRTLSGVATYWRADKAPPAPGISAGLEKARIWLRWNSGNALGTDEERERYNPDTDQNEIILIGQRQLTLSLRAESLDVNLEPLDLCERVRFRLRTQVARAIFAPASLSLRDVQPITELPGVAADDRIIKVATMDIRWNYRLQVDPMDPGEGGYIKTVDGGGIIPGKTS